MGYRQAMVAACLQVFSAGVSHADEAAILARLRASITESPTAVTCAINPDDFAFLSRAFPVTFPASVPTAITSDGKIHSLVQARFDEIFRGR